MKIAIDSWAWLPKDQLTASQLSALRSALTVIPKHFDIGDAPPPAPLKLYVETPTLFGAAREYILRNRREHHKIVLNTSSGAEWPGDLAFNGELRPEQLSAVQHVTRLLVEGTELGGMIQAAPGWGKTVATSALIAALRVPTLVVVHKEFLMSQWQERLTQFLPGIRIGICQQDECDYEGKHVVIGMVHTLADREFSKDFLRWPGLMIVDEAHRIGAATWSVVPGRFPTRWRIGVTATPRRKDGAERVFEYHLGKILYRAKEQRLKPRVRKVFTTFSVVRTPSFDPSSATKPLLVSFLCANPIRNALIAKQVVLALQAGRKVLVLSERLAHLESIEKLVIRLWPEGSSPPTIDYYVGGRSEAQRKQAAKARVVLATSQFAAEGLDIPALDTIVLATPMSDVEQAVGRILRPCEGKKDPVVVDIRDDKVPLFRGMAFKRDQLYTRIT